MTPDLTSRRVRVLACVAAGLMLCTFPPRRSSPLVLYNRTPSLPTGFYVYCGGPAHRGDVVAFALPRSAWPYARLRGEATDLRLLKHVLAAGGDFVSTRGGEFRVNGVCVGPIAPVDAAGRPLRRWSAARVLSEDELLVGSTYDRSFDSRYFGPIHTDQVLGVYRPLSFRFRWAQPSVCDAQGNPLSCRRSPPLAQSACGG